MRVRPNSAFHFRHSSEFSQFRLSGITDRGDSKTILEYRIQRVLKMMEEAGFGSIDEMMTTYYIAKFEDDSLSY